MWGGTPSMRATVTTSLSAVPKDQAAEALVAAFTVIVTTRPVLLLQVL